MHRQFYSLYVFSVGLALTFSFADSPIWAKNAALRFEKPQTDLETVGSIKHSENLKPVAACLRGGVSISDEDKDKLQKRLPANFWFKIPTWLAGRWQYYQGETLDYLDVKTGKVRRDFALSHNEATADWGYQKDRDGAIWQYEDVPHYNETRQGDYLTLYIREQVLPLSVTPSAFTCSMTYTYATIVPSTHKVVRTYQSESIVTYSLKEKGEIRRDVSAKIFDENGAPLAISRSYSLAKRIQQYIRVDKKDDKDLRAMFSAFLNEHGWSSLIPDWLDGDADLL